MRLVRRARPLIVVLAVSACAVVPPAAPTIAVVPPPGKDVTTFRNEDSWCRRHSSYAVAYDPAPAYVAARANQASAASIVTGAAIGALVGSVGGRVGAGALVGAAYGLAVGAATASNGAQTVSGRMQAVYDVTYIQCMAAYANRPVVAVVYPHY